NLTGQWITAPEATNPNYGAAPLRQTLRFADGLAELARGQKGILLEVGPGQTLTTLARQHPAASAGQVVIASLAHAKEKPLGQASMLKALGRLWLAGLAAPGPGFFAQERRHRLPLPTYSFERKRYWVEPADLGESDKPVPQNVASGRAEPPTGTQKKSKGNEGLRFDSTPLDRRESDTLSELKAVFQELSGANLSLAGGSATFLELGFDSLFLTQASQAVQKRFGASLTFRQLLEEFPTLEKLAAYLDTQKPRAGNDVPESAGAPRVEQGPVRPSVRHVEAGTANLETFPLTAEQREVWFATQLGAAVSAAYNESCTLRLRGPFQLDALRLALQQLVERHDALRTTFSPAGDAQRIAPALRMNAPLVDFSDADERDQEMRVNDLIAREVRLEFDLVNGPLLRARIVRLAADHHLLVLMAHHIICDGWSMSVLLYELGELYSANRRGVPCALPEPMPFSRYAQREAVEQRGPEFAVAEAYWLKQFSDSVPVLELPSDRPRPARRTYAGSHRARSLKPELAAALRRFSAECNCTTFTT